jgi:WhiB family redox-sensing transcriptional regulator
MGDNQIWAEQGICSSQSNLTHLFFSHRPEEMWVAKRICVDCPVKRECLEWAIKNKEFGIWGGTDDSDRLNRLNYQLRQDALLTWSRKRSQHALRHQMRVDPSYLDDILFGETRTQEPLKQAVADLWAFFPA